MLAKACILPKVFPFTSAHLAQEGEAYSHQFRIAKTELQIQFNHFSSFKIFFLQLFMQYQKP